MRSFLIALIVLAAGSISGPRHRHRHGQPSYLAQWLSGNPSEAATLYFVVALAVLTALLLWALWPQIYRVALWLEARQRRPGAD